MGPCSNQLLPHAASTCDDLSVGQGDPSDALSSSVHGSSCAVLSSQGGSVNGRAGLLLVQACRFSRLVEARPNAEPEPCIVVVELRRAANRSQPLSKVG